MSIYPGAIPTNSNYPNRTDDVDWLYATRYNEVKNEIIAICAELGINPKGASATVVARLALLALKASPTFTGQATIPTINLTGGQIAFPATAVPSADPNTIDDYEKGTFTSTVTCATSGSYTVDAGNDQLGYTKIGRSVHAHGFLNITGETSPNGYLRVSMPFTSADLTEGADHCVGNLVLRNHGGATKNNYTAISGVTTFATLASISDAGVIHLIDEGDVDAAFYITLDITYESE